MRDIYRQATYASCIDKHEGDTDLLKDIHGKLDFLHPAKASLLRMLNYEVLRTLIGLGAVPAPMPICPASIWFEYQPVWVMSRELHSCWRSYPREDNGTTRDVEEKNKTKRIRVQKKIVGRKATAETPTRARFPLGQASYLILTVG